MNVGEYGQGLNAKCDFRRKTAQLKARPGLKRADEVDYIQPYTAPFEQHHKFGKHDGWNDDCACACRGFIQRCAGCRAQQGGTGQIPQQRVGVGYVDSHVIPGRLEGESASPVHAPKSV